jgi:hypothetical protein
MASVTSNATNQESVDAGLAPFRERASRLAVGRTVLLGALIFLLGLLAAMWFDLVWPIPTSARWGVTRLGLLSGLIATIAVCLWRIRHLTKENLARWIDSQARTGGETLAGWQLEQRPPAESAVISRGLAAMASARAGTRLRTIAPDDVLPNDRLRKAALLLCGAVVVVGLLTAIMPGVAWNQWQRFLFPSRDVPPYTGVTIELTPADLNAVYGDDVSIQAKVTSGRADDLELVTIAPDGREHKLPMLQQTRGEWQAVLMRVAEPLEFYARSGRSRSRIGRLQVQMTPRILSAKVRITAPEYTQRPAYEGAIPKDGISGLAGTKVEFTATSNRPLRDGRLTLNYRDGAGDQVTLEPVAPAEDEASTRSTTVRGTIELKQAGSFNLSVFDTEGLESLDRVSGTIAIAVDKRPVVRILQPKPLSLATPDITLPVAIAAEDDFGITRLQLFRSLNGSAATAVNCSVDGSPQQNATVELPLDRYGLAPGDEIQLFARTEDNDPAGPKGAESPITTIRIISTEEFQAMILREKGAESIAAKYQEAERYLEKALEALEEAQKVAEAAAKNADSKEANAELQNKLSDAQIAASEAGKAMEQLAKEPMPIDVDKELAKRLGEMAEKANKAAGELGEMAKSQAGSRPLEPKEMEALKKMAESMGGDRKDLEQQAIKPLETLQLAMPLIMDQQHFIELANQQRDLAQRLDSLRSTTDANDADVKRRVAELEAEQQQLRETLGDLLDDIAAQAAALPDVPDFEQLKATAQKFANEVRDSQAQPSMASAQENLLSNNFPGAADDAKRAADILASFIKKCEGMGNSACQSCKLAFNPSLGRPGLGNSIEQMMAMMGMKPGAKSGGAPGMSFGFGAGGGYSVRQPGPQNVGMYGSMPMMMSRRNAGRGNRTTQGGATNASGAPQQSGAGDGNDTGPGNAEGQAASNVPPAYRAQVAEYFRQLAEKLGEEQ